MLRNAQEKKVINCCWTLTINIGFLLLNFCMHIIIFMCNINTATELHLKMQVNR